MSDDRKYLYDYSYLSERIEDGLIEYFKWNTSPFTRNPLSIIHCRDVSLTVRNCPIWKEIGYQRIVDEMESVKLDINKAKGKKKKQLQGYLRLLQLGIGETITFTRAKGNASITLAMDYYMSLSKADRNKLERLWR